MDSLRIAWLNQFDPLNPWAGGAERHIAEVSKGLVELGNEATIFAERFAGSRKDESFHGVNIVRPSSRFGIPLWAASYFRHTTEFDVVIRDLSKALPWGPVGGWQAPSIAIVRHLNGPILVREVPLFALPLWAVEHSYGRFLRGIPVVTEARTTARKLARLGIPLTNISLLRPGVDKTIFSPCPGTRSEGPLILYVGRLKRYKRVDLALRAFRSLHEELPASRMIVAGEGVDSARLQRLSDQLGLSPYVDFVGKVDLRSLVELYRQAWLNVQPSSAEGWGYTVMEAAACGTPTVAVAGTALEESVGPDCQGYLALTPDPRTLADAMSRCLSDMASRTVPIERRMVEYASHFEWKDTCASFSAIVRRAIDQSRVTSVSQELRQSTKVESAQRLD